jgi:hypothetical protein
VRCSFVAQRGSSCVIGEAYTHSPAQLWGPAIHTWHGPAPFENILLAHLTQVENMLFCRCQGSTSRCALHYIRDHTAHTTPGGSDTPHHTQQHHRSCIRPWGCTAVCKHTSTSHTLHHTPARCSCDMASVTPAGWCPQSRGPLPPCGGVHRLAYAKTCGGTAGWLPAAQGGPQQ